MFKNIFKSRNKTHGLFVETIKEMPDETNYYYVCLSLDPINTIKDLRKGDWFMEKVQESLAMGIIRYAKQSEVDKAKEIGRIKD